MSRTLMLAFIGVLLPAYTFAQSRASMPAALFAWYGERELLGPLDPIATDRPDFTEASSTVGLGVTQLESGYTYTTAQGTRLHSWGEPLLRQGLLANWLELRLAARPVSFRDVTTTSGFDDLYLGTKLALFRQQGFLPEVAIVPQMTVPSGTSAFTANRIQPGTNLLYGWDITEKQTIAGSTQYNRPVDGLMNLYDEWAQSVTLGRSLAENFGSYFEWYAFFPAHGTGVPTTHYLDGGFTYLLSDDVQLDIRAGKGLSQESDDYFFGTGLSIRFH